MSYDPQSDGPGADLVSAPMGLQESFQEMREKG